MDSPISLPNSEKIRRKPSKNGKVELRVWFQQVHLKEEEEEMEIYKMGEYARMDIPNADSYYNKKILTDANKAKIWGVSFASFFPAGNRPTITI